MHQPGILGPIWLQIGPPCPYLIHALKFIMKKQDQQTVGSIVRDFDDKKTHREDLVLKSRHTTAPFSRFIVSEAITVGPANRHVNKTSNMSTVGERCPTKILRSHVGAQTACNRGACSDTWLSLLLACQSTSSCLGGMKCWSVLESCAFLSTQVPTTMSQVLLKVKTWFSLESLKHSESHVSSQELRRFRVRYIYYRVIPWPTLLTVAFLLQQSEACISVAAQHGQATFTIKSTVLFRKALIRSICLEIHLPRHNGQVGTSVTYKWPSIKINGLKKLLWLRFCHSQLPKILNQNIMNQRITFLFPIDEFLLQQLKLSYE